ncbi:Predicted arabinose efflux permease, MFS family [Epilithonimonas bovis DSM 19482]|uniref:Predicted arabinose efflux permease, MFS family n=1 Tax=Epilithonimonas bovis DSM 19482 TaxID=1121284 RepID=A0A1U7PY05_9FLAO|nr:MFS transporter [Epilithonimonas bovis]SIT98588.1 Predicted arabinose efflux permease, MFS family [Epilithonimonas bovis DSM 19482]
MTEEQSKLTKGQVLGMAVVAGICVSNIYYAQPILYQIAQTFHVSESKMGIMVGLGQVGYGAGLLTLVPLGDKVNRKKLILILLAILFCILAAIGMVTQYYYIFLFSLLLGLTAVAAQVILPMAAELSGNEKGKNVGIIFTGILVGILMARVFSGYISEWSSWKVVYYISAGFTVLSLAFVYYKLPSIQPTFKDSYFKLISSSFYQLKRFPKLRYLALMGGLAFSVFCSFWTTLTLLLVEKPYRYSSDTIGLFGLLGIAGALIAPMIGKTADKGGSQKTQLFAGIILLLGSLFILLFPSHLVAVLLAVIFIDVGVQSIQVTNVALIYKLDQKANSRINTIYMTSYFVGGALGTFIGLKCWELGGWHYVGLQLGIFSVVIFLMNLFNFIKPNQAKLNPS